MAGRDTRYAPSGLTDLTKTTLADVLWNFATRIAGEDEGRRAAFALIQGELDLLVMHDKGAKNDASKLRRIAKQDACAHRSHDDSPSWYDLCHDCGAMLRKTVDGGGR